jgi:hypothetical protein
MLKFGFTSRFRIQTQRSIGALGLSGAYIGQVGLVGLHVKALAKPPVLFERWTEGRMIVRLRAYFEPKTGCKMAEIARVAHDSNRWPYLTDAQNRRVNHRPDRRPCLKAGVQIGPEKESKSLSLLGD